MRILQLIDSLEVGGAERIAVNYANGLSSRIEFSGIVATRKEGALRSRINENVFFRCLNKRFTFDFGSILRLRSLCKIHKIEWIHAHGTSYFTAFLLKIFYPRIKILWHEHAGSRSEEKTIHNRVLWVLSHFFSGIIVVNRALEHWCQQELSFTRVIYLPNFAIINANESKETFLRGVEGKRIVCLANLRNPKNHKLLVEVAIKLKQSNPDWSFHFIGKDLKDAYSSELKSIIEKKHLEENVFIYNLREDIDHILQQASIGVLASSSEGLPVALLEYGMHGKAVVVTNVGEMPSIVVEGVSGFVVSADSKELFYEALMQYINSPILISRFGNALNTTIQNKFTEEAVLANYINWIYNELKC